MDPHFASDSYTLNKHMHTDDAMQEVLRRVGERRFRLPDLPYRIGTDISVHPQDQPWKVINGGARDSKGKHVPGLVHRTGKHPHHAFYDAHGYFTVKRVNKEPAYRFYETSILSHPDVTYDSTTFINHVIVHGAKAQGKGKKPVKAEISLPRHNPLSPWRLARNGKPRYLTLETSADNLKTDKECRQRAHHLLNHHSQVGVNISFDCLPIPTLEPGDVIRVKTEAGGAGFEIHAPLKTFTIPLTSSDPMSIGYNRKLKTTGKGGHGGHGGGPGGPSGHNGHHNNHG